MKEAVAPVQSFGEFVRCGRLLLNLTQEEVATKAGVNQGYLSRVESGEREPTVSVALKLCDVLDLDINDFASKYI
jgi:transcriptional regulator with XRE-family HTH domain